MQTLRHQAVCSIPILLEEFLKKAPKSESKSFLQMLKAQSMATDAAR
jgi:hypothetical protein